MKRSTSPSPHRRPRLATARSTPCSASCGERLYRYDDAAASLRSYINLLPNKDRSDKAAWARAQVEFLDLFKGVRPSRSMQEDRAVLHTLPFRLVNDKAVVRARINGSNAQDFVLDTGSEETIISPTRHGATVCGR